MNKIIFTMIFALCAQGLTATELLAEKFVGHKTVVRDVVYSGKTAIQVQESTERSNEGEDKLAILDGTSFQDGEIEVWVAGDKRKDAFSQARGFVGIAFRIADDRSKFEAIYLRPANGRANDQLRRNHSVQYFSYPDYPWHLLRRESPARYEAYADMELGKWTKYHLVVRGAEAKLYLDGNSQPTLIVSDLKHGESKGAVGLWIGPGTEAHFSGLKVSD